MRCVPSNCSLQPTKRADPELAQAALDLFDKRDATANLFANQQPHFVVPDCYAALAAGRWYQVLQVIGAVRYGIYT